MLTEKSSQQSQIQLTMEEDENKKLFDQLFAGGGDSDSESFEEYVDIFSDSQHCLG
jgi:hypothetical protein